MIDSIKCFFISLFPPTNRSQFVKYLLIPRPLEWYKILFTVAGYTCACLCMHSTFRASALVELLFLFEFLAYGARYQFNDLLGIAEDLQIGRTRIFSEEEPYTQGKIKVKVSAFVTIIKCGIAILGAFLINGQKMNRLLLSYALLLVSTILYETIKFIRNRAEDGTHSIKKCRGFSLGVLDYSVYNALGSGYPLRFLTGLWLGYPSFGLKDLTPSLIWFLASLWFLGVFASLLSWACSITSFVMNQNDVRPMYLKQYYFRLHSFLKLRNKGEPCRGKGKNHLLRGQSGFSIEIQSPWNQFYIASTICAFLAVRHCGCSDFRDMILILVAVGLALGSILTGDLTMLIIVLIQYLFLLMLLLKACDPWFCFLLINLGVIAGTYAFIRYEPL